MKIHLSSVMVDDQEKALGFYTDVPGFVKKTESRFAIPPARGERRAKATKRRRE